MTLTDIEKKYGFEYPAIYKKLEQDGMLNVGEYGPTWYNEIFLKIKDNPTLFLHTYDFELLSVQAVDETLGQITSPDYYRKPNPNYKFVPFGQSGAGDLYCFFVSEKADDNIPIVFIWHDMNQVDYLAKNLNEYIFKVMLTDMSILDDADESEDISRSNIQNTLKTHSKYLTQQQSEILHNISNREFTDYEEVFPNGLKESQRGLLTNTEVDEILDSIIPYERYEKSIKYKG